MNADAYYRTIKVDRNAWRDEMARRCMWCGKQFDMRYFRWPEVHEILSRAQAPNRWGFRANYLALCNPCHQFEIPTARHAEQLAVKLKCDARHYDLTEWLWRRNPRAMQYVTEAEVRQHLERRIA